MELISIAISIALVLALLLLDRSLRRPWRLPPGPIGFPIVGSMFSFRRFLLDPAEPRRLAARYGPVFTLQMGSVPLIVITSAAAAHSALVEQGAVFASRPATRSPLSNGNRSVNTAPYGDHWRVVRRTAVAALAAGISRLGGVRRRAVERLVSDLRAAAASGASAVEARPMLGFAVFSILSYMCFGLSLDDDETFNLMKLMRLTMRMAARRSILEFLPLVRLLPLAPTKDETNYMQHRREFIGKFINRARDLYNQGALDPNCYLHNLFQVHEQQGLSDEDLVVLASEFINAGADTTTLTLEWTLACLVKHPQVQSKLYDEIRAKLQIQKPTLGIDGDAGIDGCDLPYLQAVIKEVLRKFPPTFATLPHAVTENSKLEGYDIPKNALILFHIYSMGNDPSVWKNPEEFDPERFLHRKIDYTNSASHSYAPFGAGRRICPGIGLATVHLHLFIAKLVQTFEWSAQDGDPVDMTPKLEFTVLMKNPLKAVLKEHI